MRTSRSGKSRVAVSLSGLWAGAALCAGLISIDSAWSAESLAIVVPASTKWLPCIPDKPDVCQFAPFKGDPAKEPSHRYVRTAAGFMFPKHWHVSAENLVVISGTVVINEDGREQALHPGDYVNIPVGNVHWGSCPEPCLFYLKIDGPDSFNVVEEKK
jgi:quercetin dioxygenase-like cupin family protein